MIAGVVLAAGQSRRMGAPKPLLLYGGETFLARAVRALREGGCEQVVVVAGPEGDGVADAVAAEAERCGARVVRNPHSGSEQVDSLRLAVRALPASARAVVFTPVDHPRLPVAAVRAVVDGYLGSGAPVVVPSLAGEHGHPTLFAAALFPELFEEELAEGARTLVDRHRARLLEVPVADAGILLDVNTPAELREVLG